MADQLTGEVTELLQQLIRNQCVNDGSPESGEEVRSADLLRDYLEGSGVDIGDVRRVARPALTRRPHRGQRPECTVDVPHGPHRRRAGDPEWLVSRSLRG